jgi:hypothetical protein
MCSPACRHEDKTYRYRYCIYLPYSNRQFPFYSVSSVAVQDVEPGSRFFYIQDPGSQISEVFVTKKLVNKLSKTCIGSGIRDQRSRIWKKVSRILDPAQLVKKTLYLGAQVWISNSAYQYGMVSNTPYGTIFNAFRNSATSKQTISVKDGSNQCSGSGSGIPDLGSQTHTFESSVTIFWVKSSIIL